MATLFLSIYRHKEGPAKPEEGSADSAESVGELGDVLNLSIDLMGLAKIFKWRNKSHTSCTM